MSNGQAHAAREQAAMIATIEQRAEQILKVLYGERGDVGVMACIQAAVTILRQNAIVEGTPSDAVTAAEKLEHTIATIKEAERASLIAPPTVQQ